MKITLKIHMELQQCSPSLQPHPSIECTLNVLENNNQEMKHHLIAVRETITSMARTLELIREALPNRGDERASAAEGDTIYISRHRDDGQLLPPKVGDASHNCANRAANMAKLKASSVVQLSSSGGGYQPQYADVQESEHRLNPLNVHDSDSGQSNDIISPVKDINKNSNNGTKLGCLRAL